VLYGKVVCHKLKNIVLCICKKTFFLQFCMGPKAQ
jgi:hypothetical protein